MDETSLRGLLEIALGDEPPIGPVARNSLRAGIRLRRRARVQRAAGGTAVVVAAAAVIPAVTGVLGHTAAAPHSTPRRALHPAPRPWTPPKGIAYVINSGGGTVTPIDLATSTPGKPIKASGEIVAMTIAPDGKTAYVATGLSTTVTPSSQGVQPIDLVTNTPGKPINLQWPPDAIVISQDEKTAYIINGFPSRTVTPIDLATNTPGKSITLSGPPTAIAIAPDGKAYVAIQTGKKTGRKFRVVYEFMSIDLATGKLGKPVKLSGMPGAIAIGPDGKTAYAAALPDTVTPIDLTTDTAGKPIKLGGKPGPTGGYMGEPLAIAITPDGKTAYLANGAPGTVTPIDLATNTPGKPISLSGKPGADAIAISPDGTTAYVANQPSGTVTPIDLATNTAEKPIKDSQGWDSGFEAIAIVP